MVQPPDIDGPPTIPQPRLSAKRRLRSELREGSWLLSLEKAIYEHVWLLAWLAGTLIVSAGITHRLAPRQLLGGAALYLWVVGFGLFFGACLVGMLRTGKFWSTSRTIEPSPFEWFIALTGTAVVLGPFARVFVIMGFGLLANF